MHKRRTMAALTALICSAPLAAQSIPEDAGIAGRIGDEYKPIGGRIGSFILYPEATVTANHTDNILATDSGKRSDEYLKIRPALRLVSQGGADRVSLSSYFERKFHADLQSENTSEYGARGFVRIGPADRSRLEATVIAERLVDSRESIENVVAARKPVHRGRFVGDIAYTHQFNRFSLLGGATVRRLNYADARDRAGNPLDQDFRDVTAIGVRSEARYLLRNGMSAIAKFGADRLRYDFGPEDAAFDPVIDRDRDSRRLRAEAGFGFAIADILYGDATVGYLDRRFKRQLIPLRNVSGFSFNVDLLWNVNPLTTVRIAADRDFLESSSRTIAGYRSTGGKVQVDYAVLRPLIVSVAGNFAHIDPIGPGLTRKDYGGSASIRYFLNRRYSIMAEYRHGGRNSKDPQAAYEGNYFLVGLKTTL